MVLPASWERNLDSRSIVPTRAGAVQVCWRSSWRAPPAAVCETARAVMSRRVSRRIPPATRNFRSFADFAVDLDGVNVRSRQLRERAIFTFEGKSSC